MEHSGILTPELSIFTRKNIVDGLKNSRGLWIMKHGFEGSIRWLLLGPH